MVFVDRTGKGWPRRLENKNSFNVITFQLLACNKIENGRLNAEEGDSRGAGLVMAPGNGVTAIDPVSVCL